VIRVLNGVWLGTGISGSVVADKKLIKVVNEIECSMYDYSL
jgi:hypothetical protein